MRAIPAIETPIVKLIKSFTASGELKYTSVALIRIPIAVATGIHLASNRKTLCLDNIIYFFLPPFRTSELRGPAVPIPTIGLDFFAIVIKIN